MKKQTNMRKQRGMTLISWLVVVAVFIFFAVTAIKVIPMYVKYDSVKSLIDSVAADPRMVRASKQKIYATIDDYININGIYDLSSKQFTIEKVKTSKKDRIISVNYESRQNWFANLDVVGKFEYSKVIGAEDSVE